MREEKCPICHSERTEPFCRQCGWDFTADCLEYGTLSPVEQEMYESRKKIMADNYQMAQLTEQSIGKLKELTAQGQAWIRQTEKFERLCQEAARHAEQREEELKKVRAQSQEWREKAEKFERLYLELEASKEKKAETEKRKPENRILESVREGSESREHKWQQYITPTRSEIWAGEFWSDDHLTNILISDNVERIGNRAFSKCKKLKEVNLPPKLKEIENYAFEECDQIKELIIPETVTKIGRGAFYGCKSLEKICLPKALQELGSDVFKGCQNLEWVTFPKEMSRRDADNIMKNVQLPSKARLGFI